MSPRRRPEPEAPFRTDRGAILAAARRLVSVRHDSDTPFDREGAYALLRACGTDPGGACAPSDPTPIRDRSDFYVEARARCDASCALGLSLDDDCSALRKLLGSAS